MIKSEGLPSSLRGGVKSLKEKVITLLIGVTIFLSTGFMVVEEEKEISIPEPSYVTESVELYRSKEEIIENYIKKLEEEGYSNITYIENPLIESENNLFISLNEKSKIINALDFITEYRVVTVDKENYYFKSKRESENFISKLKKYDVAYTTKKGIKKKIRFETSKELLEEIITNKKMIFEKKEAERLAREAEIRAQEEARLKAEQEIYNTQVQVTQSVTSASGNAIVNYALQFNGNPYVSGGTSLTNGADCSGFVQSIFAHFGINLPRVASAQATVGYAVSYDQMQAGDLVFYSGNGGASITHVAIYIGNSQIIHAQTPSDGIGVTTSRIMTFVTARRVI